MILIDCRANHNVISQRLVDELKFPLTTTSNYGIIMGNGLTVKGKGVCKVVVVNLPKLFVQEDFLPLDLEGVDMILGMWWLRTMGFMGLIGHISR